MRFRWVECGTFAAVCALVIGVYSYAAHSGPMELLSPDAADAYYNLLVQGFRAGELNLKKEVSPGFAQLPDPYDPAASILYRFGPDQLHDLSYYKGRFYLYFGVTPALILFWPYTALTGCYLYHRQAVVIFCSLGFLVSVALLWSAWRRYFAQVSLGAAAVCALTLGLASGLPMLLARSEIYEVAVCCSYMLAMLSLGAIWCSFHESKRRHRWLVAASVAYGLAVGARPELLFGAVILLAPVFRNWRGWRTDWVALAAVSVPILLIGLGLMLYNVWRFGDPFEFGLRYQLAPTRMDTGQHFSLRFVWFHLRVYFLEPARWNTQFPFVHQINLPPVPVGHNNVEKPFGVLTNLPLVWLALMTPLAWLGRSGEARSTLRTFVAGVSVMTATCALVVCTFWAASVRYEVGFLGTLMILSVFGVLGLERAVAEQPAWRWAVRWVWGLLMGFSVIFSLLTTVITVAEADCYAGNVALQTGRLLEAKTHYEQALRIKPDFAEAHSNLGSVLLRLGQAEEAIREGQRAVQIDPNSPEAHNRLGVALHRAGRIEEAIEHFTQATRQKPDFAEAHFNLGVALEQAGRFQEAIIQYQQTLQIRKDFVEARNCLDRLSGVH